MRLRYFFLTMTEANDIDAIDDLEDLFHIMASIGVSSKGLKTLDELKDRVKGALKMYEKSSGWTGKEVRYNVGLRLVASISHNQELYAELSLQTKSLNSSKK